MEEKEARIRKITQIYYSNPKVQEAILKFSKDREVVPRYFEGFGKRPDNLQYTSDITGFVKRGATSFHASEEIWHDPLSISSEMSSRELGDIRKGWDLVIDVDSNYLDLSKLLTKLTVEALERNGVKNYSIKFSGSKGFHIIVSAKAFPVEFEGKKTKEMFPEWPRAICEFLMHYIKRDYNKKAREIMPDIDTIKKRTNLVEKDFLGSVCPNCGRNAKKGNLVTLKCPDCGFSIKRKDMKITKKRLSCPQNDCAGILEICDQEEYFQCEYCKDSSSINKREVSGLGKAVYEKEAVASDNFEEEMSGEIFGSSDLVLVAPRHLFRMPYSLHEKTALASVVLNKDEIEKFDPPKDADPLRAIVKDFLPENEDGEAERLLANAIEWKKKQEGEIEKVEKKKYGNYKEVEITGATEEMFPKPIQKLLKGLKEGRKRGLFILLTFLKSLNFSAEYINNKTREWNKLNDPPLKEGYVKSQIDWHLRQRKKILPPNYENNNFYKDLGLLEGKPNAKNPIVEVLRKIRAKTD